LFTGIIEEVGKLKRVRKARENFELSISCQEVTSGTRIGDSIGVNGVCLTVTSLEENGFSADVMPETYKKTNLTALKPGEPVNLERALTPDKRIGGHFVTGHVDAPGMIIEFEKGKEGIRLGVKAPAEISDLLLERGSIAIDGISLTVSKVQENNFWVSLIPHTLKSTTLQHKTVGNSVNLETDLLGKYVQKFMGASGENSVNEEDGDLTWKQLQELGF